MTFIVPSKDAWNGAKASVDSVVNKVVVYEVDKKGLPLAEKNYEQYGPKVSLNSVAVKKLSDEEKDQLKELVWDAFINRVDEDNGNRWYEDKLLREIAKAISAPMWEVCKAEKAEKPKSKAQQQAEVNVALLNAISDLQKQIAEMKKNK